MELLYKVIQPISFFVIVYLLIVKENEKEGFSLEGFSQQQALPALPAALPAAAEAAAAPWWVFISWPLRVFLWNVPSALIVPGSARKGGLKNNGKYIIPKVSIPPTFKLLKKYIIKHIKYYILIYIYVFSFKWLSWELFYTSKAWQEKGTSLWMFFKGVGIFIYHIFVDLFTGSEPKKGFFGVIIRLFYLIFWWLYFVYFIFPFSLIILFLWGVRSLGAFLIDIIIDVVKHLG